MKFQIFRPILYLSLLCSYMAGLGWILPVAAFVVQPFVDGKQCRLCYFGLVSLDSPWIIAHAFG